MIVNHYQKLVQLEEELDNAIQDYYESEPRLLEAEKQIKREHIEQLVMEIIHKRDQIHIYEENLRYLEKQRAKYELDAPTKLINELKLTSQKIEQATKTRFEAEKELQEQYFIDSEVLQKIDGIDKEDIAFVVEYMASMYAKRTLSRHSHSYRAPFNST